MSQTTLFFASVMTVAGGTALLAAPRMDELMPESAAVRGAASAQTAGSHKARFAGARQGFRVEAKVDGRPVRFLLDTGASITVLSAADAEHLGVATTQPRRVAGLGGTVTARMARVDLEIAGHRIDDVQVAIVENIPRSLLGLDVMYRLGTPELVIN